MASSFPGTAHLWRDSIPIWLTMLDFRQARRGNVGNGSYWQYETAIIFDTYIRTRRRLCATEHIDNEPMTGWQARTGHPKDRLAPCLGVCTWPIIGSCSRNIPNQELAEWTPENSRAGEVEPLSKANPPQPRPMNGILVAMTVMLCTFDDSGRLAM